MKKNLIISFSLTALLFATIISCNKSSSAPAAGQQNLTMFLTDAPGDYQHVYVDIRSVFVKIEKEKESGNDSGGDNSNEEWVNLNANAKVYDLLALNNGIDALLANSNTPLGQIKEIKLELGTNNSIVINGITFPLQLDASEAEVEIECNNDNFEEDGNSQFRIWLDFDVSSSVLELPGNIFWLRPVINMFNQKASGEIEGKINPASGVASIKIYNANHTYFGTPEEEGEFKIRGIAPGTYTIEITGKNGYRNETRTNITVKAGEDTKIENIQLIL